MKYIVLLFALLIALPLQAQYNLHYTATQVDTAIGRALRFLEPTYVRVDSATWATRYWTGTTFAQLASPVFSGTPKIGSDTIATQAYARLFGGGSSTDTTSLSSRIDLKVTRADTSSWLPTWADINSYSWNKINLAQYTGLVAAGDFYRDVDTLYFVESESGSAPIVTRFYLTDRLSNYAPIVSPTFSSTVRVNGVFTLANGTATTFSTRYGANSTGNNIWIGGGGLSSIGQVNETEKGSNNVAIGLNTLKNSTTGYYNTAIGSLSLYSNTTGYYNIALGNSMYMNSTGYGNTALGSTSLYNNTIGYYNTVIGYGTGLGITTGANNTILGANVTGLATGLSNNIIIADGAGNRRINVDANGKVGIGNVAPDSTLTVTGSGKFSTNLSVGSKYYIGTRPMVSLYSWGGDDNNVWLGGATNNTLSGGISVQGNRLVAIGLGALGANTTGWGNIAVGYNALQANTTGYANTSIGDVALQNNTTGSGNVAIGTSALYTNLTGQANVAIGQEALNLNTTGSNNVAIGTSALQLSTIGYYNNAIGFHALYHNTSGFQNSAFGTFALHNNTEGSDNNAVGFNALNKNTTGRYNNSFGSHALFSNTTSYSNNAFGDSALYSNTTAGNNNAFGESSLHSNTGYNNNAFGYWALRGNTTGYSNLAIGTVALQSNTTGYHNNAIGEGALYLNTTGNRNNAVGSSALRYNTTGKYNNAFGYEALYSNTTGSSNIAIGKEVLYKNTTGNDNIAIGGDSLLKNNINGGGNIAIGQHALKSNISGWYSIGIGYRALEYNLVPGTVAIGQQAMRANTTGTDNVAIGYGALKANTTGSFNSAFGSLTLQYNLTGSYNSAFGYALSSNFTGSYNSAFGPWALSTNSTGSYNSAFGYSALRLNTVGKYNSVFGYTALSYSLNDGNTALGYAAGYDAIGGNISTSKRIINDYNMTLIGYSASKDNASQLNNSTALGYGATVTASNQIVLGDANITEVKTSAAVIKMGADSAATRAYARSFGGSESSIDTTSLSIRIDQKLDKTAVGDSIDEAAVGVDLSTGEVVIAAAEDSIRSVPFYEAPAMVYDSTMLDGYGTRINRSWFRTTADSVKIDSLISVMSGAVGDTVTFRVLWGQSRATPVDSTSDLQCVSRTTGTITASTKVIPPEQFVWVKVVKVTGAPIDAMLALDARRRFR